MEKLKLDTSIDFLARICISAIFINAIPLKISNFSNIVNFISDRGFPEPLSILLLILSIIVLIAGTLLLIIGKRQKLGALLLLIFIIPATLVFHLFPFETRAVLVNLGLIGGLLRLVKSK